MIGFIVCNEATYEPMRKTVLAFGDKAGAQDIFLALRGLRTLDLRMKSNERAGLDRGPLARQAASGFGDAPSGLSRAVPATTIGSGDFSGASGLFSVVLKPASESQHPRLRGCARQLQSRRQLGRLREPCAPGNPATQRDTLDQRGQPCALQHRTGEPRNSDRGSLSGAQAS